MVSSHLANRRGVLTLDALFGGIPLVLMVSYAISFSYSLSSLSAENFHRQQVFDKLVSISDYSMKIGLTPYGSDNWIDFDKANGQYFDKMTNQSKLSQFTISIIHPLGYQFCITRLGVVGSSKDVIKLYFCGD